MQLSTGLLCGNVHYVAQFDVSRLVFRVLCTMFSVLSTTLCFPRPGPDDAFIMRIHCAGYVHFLLEGVSISHVRGGAQLLIAGEVSVSQCY
jgi:hypothetical protein